MNRRDFIKKAGITGAGAMLLNHIPIRLLAKHSFLNQLASAACEDRVLVLIQLHGGNDGLNTIVPLDQYSLYQSVRPNIALPRNGTNRVLQTLDSTLPSNQELGLHPDMTGLKSMYDEGKVSVVQSVAYENMNLSHFRSRDIWFMGGGSADSYNSGWAGRYLSHQFPGYPDSYPNPNMPDPLGLEIGNGISLAFHTPDTIPASISIRNPEAFHELIDSVIGADGIPPGLLGSTAEPPQSLTDTHYADELRWIMEFELKSDQYAERLRDVYRAGSNAPNVTYPEQYPFNAPPESLQNPLSGQLKLISRLLSGGVKTKVFLARIGGFDTHALQVQPGDTTTGAHAALLYHISGAVKAFYDDLEQQGLDDRVLTLTFSEFGRRVASNISFGTDHGTAAPMFAFGPMVNPGVFGTNPDLTDLNNGNLKMQHDYRQVFRGAMEDWLTCGDSSAMNAIGFDEEASNPKVNIVSTTVGTNEFFDLRFSLNDCSPNPVKTKTTFSFHINAGASVSLLLVDEKGNTVQAILDKEYYKAGEHQVKANLSDLQPGIYFYKIDAGMLQKSKKLVKK